MSENYFQTNQNDNEDAKEKRPTQSFGQETTLQNDLINKKFQEEQVAAKDEKTQAVNEATKDDDKNEAAD